MLRRHDVCVDILDIGFLLHFYFTRPKHELYAEEEYFLPVQRQNMRV